MIAPRPWRGSASAYARYAGRASVSVVGVLAISSSCTDIVPVPRTTAPMNTCPCDAYPSPPGPTRCSPDLDICEVVRAASKSGEPDFPVWVVVHVPDSIPSAAGSTTVFVNNVNGSLEPGQPFTEGSTGQCRSLPSCRSIQVANVQSRYAVSEIASAAVGFPLANNTALPVRVQYETAIQAALPTLPLGGVLYASSRIAGRDIVADRYVPLGLVDRVFYPEAPFDALFPPRRDDAIDIDARNFTDSFSLASIDSPVPTANVTREAGLDGWHLWLRDRPTQRRISVLRTLSGTAAKDVPLYMSGETLSDGTDRVEAVVAPPDSWTAVPRYVTLLLSGQGLGNLDYPAIPPPVPVTGVVADRGVDGKLLGYPSSVTFESQRLATTTDPTPLLQYSTSVDTDDRGRFATVLPPGRYTATINPVEGTGYASARVDVDVDRTLSVTALTLGTPKRTMVRGRAVLTDGRSLAGADVVAQPHSSASARASTQAPARPSQTQTDDDGRFAVELDAGSYALSIIPKVATGFPRVVVQTDVPSSATTASVDVADVRVPPPTIFSFSLKDTTATENPIRNAVVRVYARPVAREGEAATDPDPVEIGSAMTDDTGKVELLLAQQPR